MTRSASSTAQPAPRTLAGGYFFGVPLGNLGWFSSLLMALASGFLAFFAATFLAIVFILFFNTLAHGTIDFALSYRLVGLPVGLVVLLAASSYLGMLWFKRIFRRN